MMAVVNRYLTLAVLGCLACLPPAPAQTADPPLTLEDCIRKALAVPSPLSLARRDRAIADQGIISARAGFLPNASANAGYTYNSPWQQDRTVQSYVALNGVREFLGLATVMQEIDTSGRLRAEFARARAQQQATGASVGIAERELKRAVGAAYYRLLLARHLVTALRDVLTESEAFEHRVKLLSQAGEAARADVVKASSQVAFLRQTLLSVDLAAKLANQDLAAYWTPAAEVPLNLVDTFESTSLPPDPASAEPSPYLRRFEFRLLDAQKQQFTSEAKAAKAALLPQLSWNFQYGLDVNRVAWNNRGYAAFATLHVPIFDWFKARSTARQFLLQAEQVADTRAISERRFSQEYLSALERIKQFHAQIDLCRAQMELAAEDLRLSRIRYEGGEGPSLDVVVAQNQLAQARSSYYTSIASYWTARLDLEVAAGR